MSTASRLQLREGGRCGDRRHRVLRRGATQVRAAAIIEAAEGGITFIVCITEGIPAQDEAITYNRLVEDFPGCGSLDRTARASSVPVSATSASPRRHRPRRGTVGIVSRSGTLTYQALYELSQQGIGQTTCVGIAATRTRHELH